MTCLSRVYYHLVIASEAKQSRADRATLDCRVAPLLAMTKPKEATS